MDSAGSEGVFDELLTVRVPVSGQNPRICPSCSLTWVKTVSAPNSPMSFPVASYKCSAMLIIFEHRNVSTDNYANGEQKLLLSH